MDKNEYRITDNEYQFLQHEYSVNGKMVVFIRDMPINVHRITDTRKIERKTQPDQLLLESPDKDYNFLSEEQIARNRRKMAEIRQALADKLSWSRPTMSAT